MAAASDGLSLIAGELTLDLAPAIGGSVASFRLGGIDLMRPLSAADRAAGNVLGVAMFPMVPYANRIAGNAFSFNGRRYTFAPNNPPEIYNVHGTGWHRAWRVEDADGAHVELRLDALADATGYLFEASQHFVLDEAGLTVGMSVTNFGPDPMPFGMGLHPWFDREDDVTVQFSAKQFYLEEPEGISGNRISIVPEIDFSEARALPDGWRNNNYGGWNGHAEIRWPGRGVGLKIEADRTVGHLMVYADPKRPFFCIEPQTSASGAFNRPGGFEDPEQGVIVLEPGATARASIRFGARRL
jgi:aldose 1-epimerase